MVIRPTLKPTGFVAIVSLLIVSTIAMFFALNMLMDGLKNSSLSLNSFNDQAARTSALICAEDLLLRLKQQEQFNENIQYNFANGDSCSATLTWFAPVSVPPHKTERLVNVDITGVSQGFSRSFRYELRVTKFNLNHADGSLNYMNTIDFIAINELIS